MNASPPERCILVVEDEMQLVMMLDDLLTEAGYRVLKAGRLPKALELVGTAQIDAAILDINLAGNTVFPAADALRRRGIPFIFTSGYGQDGLADDYQGWPILQKPYGVDALHRALALLLH